MPCTEPVESGAGMGGGRADGTVGGDGPGDGTDALTVGGVVDKIPDGVPSAPGGSGPVEAGLARTLERTFVPFMLGLLDTDVGGRLAFLL